MKPNPLDMIGNIDTSGIAPGPHSRPEGVTAVFDVEEDRIKERESDVGAYFDEKKLAASGTPSGDASKTEGAGEPDEAEAGGVDEPVETGTVDTSAEAPPVEDANVKGAGEAAGDDGEGQEEGQGGGEDIQELTEDQWDTFRVVDLVRIAGEQDPPVKITPGAKKSAIIDDLIKAGARAPAPN